MTDRTLSEFLGDFGKSFVDSVKSQVRLNLLRQLEVSSSAVCVI